MDARKGLRRCTPRDIVCEELTLACQRPHFFRVSLQRVPVDGSSVAARQGKQQQGQNGGRPPHFCSMKLIEPFFSRTAHLTSSRDSIRCKRACSISSSRVSRSFLRLRSIVWPFCTRITGSPSTTLRIRVEWYVTNAVAVARRPTVPAARTIPVTE